MARYSDIKTLQKFKDLRPVAPTKNQKLRDEFGSLPADWVDFLVEVGAGTVGPAPGAFKLYAGLVEPDDIYDAARAATLSDILLFGDDFQGYCVGFEKSRQWRVVEISPTDGTVEPFAASFEEYLRTWIVPDP